MRSVLRIGRRQARRLLFASVLGGVTVAGFSVAALADTSGAGVTPTIVAGNPAACSDLGITGATTLIYNSNQSGTASDGTLTVNVTTSDSITFSFAATLPAGEVVQAVLAKGGSQGGNLYDYRGLAGGGVLSDSGLHPPATGNDNQFGGISHIMFCYGQGTPTTTTTTTSTTTTTTSPPVTTTSSPPTTTTPTATVKAVSTHRHKRHKHHRKHSAKAKALSRKPVRSSGFTG